MAPSAGTLESMSVGATPARGSARYADDVYTWAREQAVLLRAGRIDALDRDNIAEELDGLAAAQVDRLEAGLQPLLIQMLVWDQRSDRRSRNHVPTIAHQRLRIEHLLRDNPGLQPLIADAAAAVYPIAAMWAAHEAHVFEGDFPREQPYATNEILHRPFELDGDR